ncbi:hypothetical protein C8R46DRAFT_1032889 [Mycena filopes]|nr:hypothetical protein C8R46DRAFT_1032889 [Mycena filopes]
MPDLSPALDPQDRCGNSLVKEHKIEGQEAEAPERFSPVASRCFGPEKRKEKKNVQRRHIRLKSALEGLIVVQNSIMAPASPAGSPLRFATYSPLPSGVTRKRQRLSANPSPSAPMTPSRGVPALPHSPFRFNSSNEVVEDTIPIPLHLPLPGDDRHPDEEPAASCLPKTL